MTNKINSRIVTVGIQTESDFQLFEGLDIRAYGQKFAGPESNTATIIISNLSTAQKNWLLRTATPYKYATNPERKTVLVTLSVGREDEFPAFVLFQGYCYASQVTMPPEIGVVLTSTANNLKASTMDVQNFGALANLNTIISGIASKYGLKPNSTATDRQIANFNYTGGLQTALNKLKKIGGVDIHCDASTLSVWDVGSVIGNSQPFILNTSNGMVSIPQATQDGVKAMCLIRPELQVGGPITIQSTVNPLINELDLFIASMSYHVTNRDDPFWYDLFCSWTKGTQ